MLWVSVGGYYEKWDESGVALVRTNELPEGELFYSPKDFWRQLAKMQMADFRLALFRGSYLEQVEAYMDGPDVSPECKILWEYATEVHRTDATLNQMAAAMGFSDEDLDGVFGLG